MAKPKVVFFCKECGYESSKWLGQCPGCKTWNSFVEEPVVAGERSRKALHVSNGNRPVRLDEISLEEKDRMKTGFSELDRVLGDGIVTGSMVLVGGDPGIGKSTLLLQVCRNLAAQEKNILYISGEESLKQIKMRANRIGEMTGNLRFLCETGVERISEIVKEEKPDLVVIDSIQTMYTEEVTSAPGSVSQVREATAVLLKLAKTYGVAMFIVGHVTKEGMVAGPRVLEHMVDAVLYFEGERSSTFRILRGQKNRFGSTNEIAVFEMYPEGLKQVLNPSELLLSGRPVDASGTIVSCAIEGTRPILMEVQALMTQTAFGMPRRTANGADYNRVNLLLAILEKRLGMDVGRYDAYVNLAGGIKMAEPGMDLAVIAALVSSYRNQAIDEKIIIFGEVGLSGEVRAVAQADLRVAEAQKLGFGKCIMPKVNADKLGKMEHMQIAGVSNLGQAMAILFGIHR